METNFNPVFVRNSVEFETFLRENLQTQSTAYFLILNDWDKLSKLYYGYMSKLENLGGQIPLYVISTFDVPNAVNIMKSILHEDNSSNTYQLKNFSKVPSLIVLHNNFPRLIDYTGSIDVELGL